MTEHKKIIKRYISQKVIQSTEDFVRLKCVIEYIDGSIETIIETHIRQKMFQ